MIARSPRSELPGLCPETLRRGSFRRGRAWRTSRPVRGPKASCERPCYIRPGLPMFERLCWCWLPFEACHRIYAAFGPIVQMFLSQGPTSGTALWTRRGEIQRLESDFRDFDSKVQRARDQETIKPCSLRATSARPGFPHPRANLLIWAFRGSRDACETVGH